MRATVLHAHAITTSCRAGPLLVIDPRTTTPTSSSTYPTTFATHGVEAPPKAASITIGIALYRRLHHVQSLRPSDAHPTSLHPRPQRPPKPHRFQLQPGGWSLSSTVGACIKVPCSESKPPSPSSLGHRRTHSIGGSPRPPVAAITCQPASDVLYSLSPTFNDPSTSLLIPCGSPTSHEATHPGFDFTDTPPRLRRLCPPPPASKPAKLSITTTSSLKPPCLWPTFDIIGQHPSHVDCP